jgi:hypothetical protein
VIHAAITEGRVYIAKDQNITSCAPTAGVDKMLHRLEQAGRIVFHDQMESLLAAAA